MSDERPDMEDVRDGDLRRDTLFPDTDTPLREDVRTLGKVVGWVLREQGGEALFRDVEAARTASIRRRIDGVEAVDELGGLLFGREGADAEALVRGFSTYFQVVNLAETTHRIRRHRDYLRAGASQGESLLTMVKSLRDAGLGVREARAALARLRIEPVFTAHPTEATRRTVLRKEQRIARHLMDRMDPSLTPPEARALLEQIRAEIIAGWQTEEHPSERRTVADEREHVLFFLTDVLYRIVPPYYEAFEDAFKNVYGEPPDEPLPTVLSFASWVGGDMDGNPNVNATTIRETLRRHRELILKRYLSELNELYQQLSQTRGRAGFDEALLRHLEEGADDAAVPARHRSMPYRVFLTRIHRRLEWTLEDADDGYASPEELLGDLSLIAGSLARHKGAHAGLFAVRRLLRRVETFGFHLAALDVRQDAEVHRRVIGEMLGEASWKELPPEQRTVRLQRVLADGTSPVVPPDREAEATLEVFRAVAECLKRYGRGAVGPYVISMAEDVDDVLSVLVLARWAGLVDAEGGVPLDVAPLFETVPALETSGGVMAALLSDADYRDHVRQRGDRQMVMIGYSDSNKDGGLAASRWALYRGQKSLSDIVAAAGVELVIFHGRGGTVSRGGGKITRAVEALPAGVLGKGSLRVTEQGETINAKYGLRGIAIRTLEQMTSAVARAAIVPAGSGPEKGWGEVMETVADESRAAYRGLVYETPGFFDYFRQATPIDVIERLRIGSRPPSRRARQGITNLRAIPWVFAWTQSRHVLPGWYGLGTGLTAAVERHGVGEVRRMARHFPFLRALLDDAEMVLAKADLGIAARYVELTDDGEGIFARIREEFERTVELILRLKGYKSLLAEDPMLRRSIRLRNPYIDPMSLLQVDLLRRWRATDRADEGLLRALVATVNGIAQGLRNTG